MQILVMVGQLVLGLSILVGLHELGHMLAAKWFGMRVERFSIGFPPTLFKFFWKGTEYQLGATPLGGYVKISGMVDESLDTASLSKDPEPWEFRAKPAWQRLIVMMGGIIFNIITGIIIFVLMVYILGERYLPVSEAKYGIVAHEIGQEIGLKTGDKILKVNGKEIKRFEEIARLDVVLQRGSYYTIEREGKVMDLQLPNDLIDKLASVRKGGQFISPILPYKVGKVKTGFPADKAGIKDGDYIVTADGKPAKFFHELQAILETKKGGKIEVGIERDGQLLNINSEVTDDGKLGFTPEMLLKEGTIQYSFIDCIPIGTKMAFDVVYLNVLGFAKIFRGEVSASNAVSGPISMAQDLYGGVWDWVNFWRITGLLSMVLAFMNFLPIPALDGGHVMFLLYEIVSGRKPSDKFLENAQKVGMVMLLSLMVFAVFNDVFKRIF
jgi:regulator of sigma E protease